MILKPFCSTLNSRIGELDNSIFDVMNRALEFWVFWELSVLSFRGLGLNAFESYFMPISCQSMNNFWPLPILIKKVFYGWLLSPTFHTTRRGIKSNVVSGLKKVDVFSYPLLSLAWLQKAHTYLKFSLISKWDQF